MQGGNNARSPHDDDDDDDDDDDGDDDGDRDDIYDQGDDNDSNGGHDNERRKQSVHNVFGSIPVQRHLQTSELFSVESLSYV